MRLVSIAIASVLVVGVPVSSLAQTSYFAILEADQEVGSSSSSALGMATLTLNQAQDALTYSITLFALDLDGLQTPLDIDDDVTGLHFHAAPAGINGGVVFGLIAPNHDLDDLVIDPVAGTLDGVWENTDTNALSDQLANLQANGLYLNVHTTSWPGGAIRGQVLPSPSAGFAFVARLEASQEVGASNSTATGTALLTLAPTLDQATYSIVLSGLDLDGLQTLADPGDDVTGLHFHAAPAGINGGVVFGLIAPNHDPDDLVVNPIAGTLDGVWENTDTNPLLGQLSNLSSGRLYLNVHTPEWPSGAIRGQLEPVIFYDGFESGDVTAWSSTVP